jgi:hypothetical protein
MKLFQKTDNTFLTVLDSQVDELNWIPTPTVEIINRPLTLEEKSNLINNCIRPQRNQLLVASDWTQIADCPLDAAKKLEWATYRQSLRDFPESVDFDIDYFNLVVWPTKPE